METDTNQTNQPSLSRPKDESLEAYKAWITEITESLNPGAEPKLTEEQWEAGWKKFWSRANP